MDPNFRYKISSSLTRLVIKLAGQTYKSTFFSSVDDISLNYVVSLVKVGNITRWNWLHRLGNYAKLGPRELTAILGAIV